MKGVTPVIAIILLLLITISILGFVTIFFQQTVEESGEDTQESLETSIDIQGQKVEIISVESDNIAVKNVGTGTISADIITITVDGVVRQVSDDTGTIAPGQVKVYALTDPLPTGSNREISAIAPGNTAKQNVDFGNPKNCKEIVNSLDDKGDGTYTIYSSGSPISVYCDMTTDDGGWTLVVKAIAGNHNHDNTNTVGTLTSPTQNTVAKLSDSEIVAIGKTNNNIYETRFMFGQFSDTYYHQWNNGYAGDFSHGHLTSGNTFKQSRKNSYAASYTNEEISYAGGCGGGHSPFSRNSQCGTIWKYSSGIGCHSGFGINANCGQPWGGTENQWHRSGTMWIR